MDTSFFFIIIDPVIYHMTQLFYLSANFTCYPLSEHAVTLEFGNHINPQTLQTILAFDSFLQKEKFDGFISNVSSYTTLTVLYNPLQVLYSSALEGKTAYDRVVTYIYTLYQRFDEQKESTREIIYIPVCYGEEYGPDLDEIAAMHGLTKEQVIQLHSETIYQVYLIGFTPGFSYLGGMSKSLASPRKPVPRNSVPAGSIGIAGEQTGIYSLNTPGGWQIIGRTPLQLFNPYQENPTLLKAGDRVKFEIIDPETFQTYYKNEYAD